MWNAKELIFKVNRKNIEKDPELLYFVLQYFIHLPLCE